MNNHLDMHTPRIGSFFSILWIGYGLWTLLLLQLVREQSFLFYGLVAGLSAVIIWSALFSVRKLGDKLRTPWAIVLGIIWGVVANGLAIILSSFDHGGGIIMGVMVYVAALAVPLAAIGIRNWPLAWSSGVLIVPFLILALIIINGAIT